MPWPARRSKICSMIGVFTTGAIGLGISPVSGKSLVPLPAASAIAFIGLSLTCSAKHLSVFYIPSRACEHSTPALPFGQVRRTLEALYGMEDRGPRRRTARARERRRADRSHRKGRRTRRPCHDPRRGYERAHKRRRHQGTHDPARDRKSVV